MKSIVILDFGSQYTQLIARRIRSLKVYSVILPPDATAAEILAHDPYGIILSGGPASVYDKGAPGLAKGVLDIPLPMLGICYGMQYMVHSYGGRIEASDQREYGHTCIEFIKESPLLSGIKTAPVVWMSHGDKVKKIPRGFETASKSDTAPALIQNQNLKRYGVQFHPEVVHTRQGTKILANFLTKVCKAKRTWTMYEFIKESIESIRRQVGKKKVVLGLSGGVDSSVLAVLLHRAIGKQLVCVFIDNGLLRNKEFLQVQKEFKTHGGLSRLKAVDASKQFLRALQGVSDPEEKRKIIGRIFVKVFEKTVSGFDFLAQGTLYPDVIESVSTKGPSDTIKTHHNRVGLIMQMKKEGRVIEPFEELFKDEVREIGVQLGVSEDIVFRQPFPGPGLAIRILGTITEKRLEVLRAADEIVISEIKNVGLYRKLWQTFAVLLPVRSVGVMGDKRTYGYTIAIRAVESVDAMTADFAYLPKPLLTRISSRIIGEIAAVNRVVLDISSKPPATIEWE